MLQHILNLKIFIVVLLALLYQLSSFGQNTKEDSLLVNREMIKWEALKTKDFGSHAEWFSKDFISIGYLPNSGVYRTGFGDKVDFPAMEDYPAATFNLSGFKILDVTENVKIISYQADGPLNLYVTTIWVEQNSEWKTIFYQATKYK